MSVQHDSSSVLAMATNSLHNALCITQNLFKHLRLRIAIVRSASRQPNIWKHTSTVSCDLVFYCSVYVISKILHTKRLCFSWKLWLSDLQCFGCGWQDGPHAAGQSWRDSGVCWSTGPSCNTASWSWPPRTWSGPVCWSASERPSRWIQGLLHLTWTWVDQPASGRSVGHNTTGDAVLTCARKPTSVSLI